MKTVGILGGMGPEATILLMQKVLGAVQARDDADHVPLIVHQNPAVPSRIKRLIDGEGEDPGAVLAQMAQDLMAAGALALAMPCNTAHAFAPQITAATQLPFLDMRTASVAALLGKVPVGTRIGMLASPAVRLVGVFDQLFAAAGLSPVYLQDDTPLLALIRSVKAGDTGALVFAEMGRLSRALAQQSDHLLIACTELSLLSDGIPSLAWTDTLDCLTSAIVAFAKGA